MAALAFEGVTKVFPDGTEAVSHFDLDVGDGELMVLVGPSGSGKSTALRMLAGLEEATAGTIRIGTRVVNDVAPKDRDIAMVFQSYALYPHMDVAAQPRLRAAHAADAARDDRRARAARPRGGWASPSWSSERPRHLSGGQRQRVAAGRAIVREPQAFLMDEPLSNLDAKLRVEMRAYIARLHHELGTTTVYVTHDQIEAMTMGDRVAVMRDGRLVQFDEPADALRPPGRPLRGRLHRLAGHEPRVRSPRAHRRRALPGPRLPAHARAGPAPRCGARPRRRPVVVGIRPEAMSHAPPGRNDDQVIEATAELVESLGSDLLVHAAVDAPAVLTEDQLELAREVGGDPAADLARARFTARMPPDVPVDEGDVLRLHVDMEHLHFFDPDTTLAIR